MNATSYRCLRFFLSSSMTFFSGMTACRQENLMAVMFAVTAIVIFYFMREDTK